MHSEPLGHVIPIYASQADAQAVAQGQLGAIPVVLAGESEIDRVLSMPCKDDATAVRTTTGQEGWIPMNSLPERFQVHCAESRK